MWEWFKWNGERLLEVEREFWRPSRLNWKIEAVIESEGFTREPSESQEYCKTLTLKPTTDSRFWTSVKMIVVKPIARKRLSKVLKRNTAEPNKKKLTSRVVKISQVTENQLQYQKAKLGKLLPPAPRQRWKYNHRDCRGFLNETSGCKKTWTFNKESKHTRSKYGCDKTPC